MYIFKKDNKLNRNIPPIKPCSFTHSKKTILHSPNKNKASFTGSLTVESAMVLPFFLFAMLSVMHLIAAVNFSSALSAGLCETATEYAKYAYAYEKGLSGGGIGGKIVSMTAAKGSVIGYLGPEFIKNAPLKNGAAGISFLRSSVLDKDEMIDLTADYNISTPYNFFNFKTIKVTDAARVRAFTGYDNSGKGKKDEKEAEEIVYITDSGSVYHCSRGCKHLKLNIMTVNLSDIPSKRANDGSKYYPCSCASGIKSGVVYITDDGNRYHGTLNCHSLKRTIKEVPISQVGGRSPCKDCY